MYRNECAHALIPIDLNFMYVSMYFIVSYLSLHLYVCMYNVFDGRSHVMHSPRCLLCSGVADDAAMRRVFELAAKIPNSSLSIANYETLLNSPGVAQLLAASEPPPPPPPPLAAAGCNIYSFILSLPRIADYLKYLEEHRRLSGHT